MDKYAKAECSQCGKLKFVANLDEQGRCLPCGKEHRILKEPPKEQFSEREARGIFRTLNRIGESAQHHFD